MTDIKMTYRKGHLYFKAKGHAGYNPGQDIVCSAVSFLAQALGGYFDAKEEVGDGSYKIEADIPEGNEKIIEFVDHSFRMLAMTVPKNVRYEGEIKTRVR